MEENRIGLTYLKVCLKKFISFSPNFRQSYLNQTILYIISHLGIQRGSFIMAKACLSYCALATFLYPPKKNLYRVVKKKKKRKGISFHHSWKKNKHNFRI